tara:strand:+ start:2621 stop:3256 length:636 start_codon:yes stop_codon:yes gene_type:complete
MISKGNQKKGILAKFIEQCIRILLIKECKKINNIRIDIISSSIQIIKGNIKKINIIAEDINYKDLMFDELELEASQVKINLNLKKKVLGFIENPKINFRIILSENSLRKILLSHNWNWLGSMVSKEVLNQDHFEDVKIKNNQISIKASKDKKSITKEEKINLKQRKGKIYLENKTYRRNHIEIPIEDKVYVKNIKIKNDLIIILADSSVSF